MLKSLLAATACTALLSGGAAFAGEAGDITRDALYSGTFSEGVLKLAPLKDAGDPEAAFGQGMIELAFAIEQFAQDLYRHGFAAPDIGPLGPAMVVPLPPNPSPEPLSYDQVRGMLERFSARLDVVTASFETAAQSGDYVILLDPLQIRIDANGDGARTEAESLERIFGLAQGLAAPGPVRPAEPPPANVAPSHPSKLDNTDSPASPSPSPAAESVSPTTVGFDRADAFWLAGYSQIFAAQADFLLAHDFEAFFNVTFHRFFPKAGLPMQEHGTGGTLALDPSTDAAIADAVAAIHTINWPVAEPHRLKGVLARLQKVTALSRANWDAILAETDDNRELVPSPKQTSIVPEGKVTDEVVAAWRKTLDVADEVLAGKLLVPHWRFRQGFDLNAYFNGAQRFDLVMLIQGYDALPFLKEGPVASAESFAAANWVFGDQWMGYVFWFN